MNNLSAWPALVLTAGLGTRLRPLSLIRAKAALPVGDDVLVRRVLRWLHDAGVRHVVLNLHHLPNTITPHVGDGRDLGLDVRYSWEPIVLGSAGGPRRALPLLDAERFLIVNGDTLTDVPLPELIDRHVSTGAAVTMTVTEGDIRYGGVMAGADDIVRGFASPQAPRASASARADLGASYGETSPKRPDGREGGPYSRFHFVGIQAVERRVFEDVRDDEPSETVRGLYPRLIAAPPGNVRIFRTSKPFYDIGTPADYMATSRHFAAAGAGTIQQGRDTWVHPTAHVTGSVLWDRVTIGAGANIVNCIVADDVTIAPGTRYRQKAIVVLEGRTVVTDIGGTHDAR